MPPPVQCRLFSFLRCNCHLRRYASRGTPQYHFLGVCSQFQCSNMPRPALVLLLALLALSAARAARERTQPISTIETVATAFTHAPKPGAAAAHRTKKASRCYRCPCTYVSAPLSCITASEVCHAANGPAFAPQLTSTPPAGPPAFESTLQRYTAMGFCYTWSGLLESCIKYYKKTCSGIWCPNYIPRYCPSNLICNFRC